jgi:formamidopyrimidine-DNA glycosylase
LQGSTIDAFELRWPRTLEWPEAAAFTAAITGRRIGGVGRRGKLVVVRLDDGSVITVHLRMTGELKYSVDGPTTRDTARDAYLRAVFSLAGGHELLLYDTRKFGRIRHWPATDVEALDRLVGLEPLDASFTTEALARVLAARRRQVKPLLLDQQVIAGLGNIYVDEALHQAGIHPLHVSNEIDAEHTQRLHDAIVDVLSSAIDNRGTTLRDYRSGLGGAGSNQFQLRIYGSRPGDPCTSCGTPIERIVVGQRGTVFCPRCQPYAAVSAIR